LSHMQEELLQRMIQVHFAPGTSVNRQAWCTYLIDSFVESLLGMTEDVASKGGAMGAGRLDDEITGSKKQRYE
jgi:hypothetical protein